MQTEPLIQWTEPITQLVGFLASFLMAGAVGFRYSSLCGRLATRSAGGGAGSASSDEHQVYQDSGSRAAFLGMGGALLSILLMLTALPALAARRHLTAGQLLTGDF